MVYQATYQKEQKKKKKKKQPSLITIFREREREVCVNAAVVYLKGAHNTNSQSVVLIHEDFTTLPSYHDDFLRLYSHRMHDERITLLPFFFFSPYATVFSSYLLPFLHFTSLFSFSFVEVVSTSFLWARGRLTLYQRGVEKRI